MAYVCQQRRGAAAALASGVHVAVILMLLLIAMNPRAAVRPETAIEIDLIEAEQPLPIVPPPPEVPAIAEAAEPAPLPGPTSEAPGKPNPPALPSRGEEPLPEAPDVTFTPAPIAAPAASAGSGEGNGSGPASGTGSGTGTGGGGGIPKAAARAVVPGHGAPEWIVKPLEQMRKLIPEKAQVHRVSGTVVLSCTIDRWNRARGCEMLSETPAEFGFGDAALRLSRHFQIRPPKVNGKRRHDVPVRIPLYFDYRD